MASCAQGGPAPSPMLAPLAPGGVSSEQALCQGLARLAVPRGYPPTPGLGSVVDFVWWANKTGALLEYCSLSSYASQSSRLLQRGWKEAM